ncbi:Fe-S cluster assembly sulfur transfer protein SufU [Lentisalinibacter salinarum]|uniref:Fe-S cluster assembly sulfur transfer protein SufU n=1 Tax=Lentisalinibacter salinarum TaxID=2992239 RepID=UPI003869B21F
MAESSAGQLRELYRELILDHARRPRHFGRPEHYTHEAEGVNPLCGDKLHLYVRVEDGEVRDAAFEGSGCAISMASASLLTETVAGQSEAEALDAADGIQAMLRGEDAGAALGKLEALAGVRDFPSRVKCASLAWHALRAALTRHEGKVSTES